MIRGLFLVVGLFGVLQGILCLGVESMTITERAAEKFESIVNAERVFSVPIWLGPTLLFTGAVTLLYAVALPAKRAR